ncbi:hypothetical protein RhiirA1_470293 [Rhizophagus irregularis]|uniref:Uncharacterized protein n=1 Tax=Rhizophagus irregularis TaxID=588596 RepID=A0A2I1EGT8_9GLOM|nr:hypothetical protein RhiirA1_470293 [Rhizophagus irregularis]PKY21342.1 hypothetical protein RhiirB3_434903 [Rhizophagus irregularis]
MVWLFGEFDLEFGNGSVSGNLEIRKTAVLWTSFARGILATGTLDLGFGDRFFGKFPSNPGRIQGHSHTRWILVTGRQFIFDGTHGFRISDLTVGRVTFDTGFLQATCSSDLFDPFFVRVSGWFFGFFGRGFRLESLEPHLIFPKKKPTILVEQLLNDLYVTFVAEYWEENTPSLETFLRYRRKTCPDEQLKKDTEHLNYAKDLEQSANFIYKNA